MSFLNKIFHTNKASPKNSLSSTMSFLFGATTAGQNVTERTAMQNTAVYACVRVLAEGLEGLPLHVYQYAKDGSKERAVNHPLYFLLHDAPNPEMTSFIFRETLMNHLLLWGNAYAQIICDGQGKITALYPLMPDRMDVNRAANGEIYYIYTRNYDDYQAKNKSEQIILLSNEVLHIAGLGFDGQIGPCMNSSINLIFCILILFSMIPLSLSFFHQIICQLHSASFDNLLLDHPVSSIFKKGRAVIEDSVIIGPSTYSSSRSHIAAATPSP